MALLTGMDAIRNGVLDNGQFLRAHYAALVTQIDHEVGQILEVLRRKGLLENTILIFSSDHGDYLGDHNLIGKGTFYESSIHVPLIVHVPRTEEAAVCQDLVSLSDVTATMLCLAGCDVPGYMDSIPLPGLGLPRPAPRECIIGMTQGGWMIDDGEWRLSKYDTGENLLFNVRRDPGEQHNLFADSEYLDVLTRLDARLVQEIMYSLREANHDHRVYTDGLSQQAEFGREGWRRPYPRPLTSR